MFKKFMLCSLALTVAVFAGCTGGKPTVSQPDASQMKTEPAHPVDVSGSSGTKGGSVRSDGANTASESSTDDLVPQ